MNATGPQRELTTAIKFVLVDDHPLVIDGLRVRLEREADFSFAGSANDTESAKALIGSVHPDVVVMDIGLPGEGGLAATRWVVRNHPDVRVLLLTGSTDRTYAIASLHAGAKGFLFKNSEGEELVRAIRCVADGGTYLSPSAAEAVANSLEPVEAPRLTPQESAVLAGIVAGLTYKEIAAKMNISAKTVETYRVRLAKKTGCRSKVALAQYAARNGHA